MNRSVLWTILRNIATSVIRWWVLVVRPTGQPLTGEGQSTAKVPKTCTKALRFSGGYDGGVEIGFFGSWRREKFHSELVSELEHAKETPDVAFDVLGRAVTVSMTGARAGLYCAHVLKTEGIKVYVHDNFEIDAAHQPVRIQYEASALTGRDLYEVHARVCRWLSELGFEISREVVSRVDLQVTCSAPCGQFFNLIRKGHSVRRGVSYNFYGGHGGDGSFSVGKATRLRIYDKLAELLNTRNELGLEMLRVECFDGELPPYLTRIEYQLRREVLKGFGIDSLRDLRDCEASLVEKTLLSKRDSATVTRASRPHADETPAFRQTLRQFPRRLACQKRENGYAFASVKCDLPYVWRTGG